MQGYGCRIYQDSPRCRVQGQGFRVPLALRTISNRLFQLLDLYWRSPDSGDKSRPLRKLIPPPLRRVVVHHQVLFGHVRRTKHLFKTPVATSWTVCSHFHSILLSFFITLGLELSDTKVYEP